MTQKTEVSAKCKCGRPGCYTLVLAKNGVVLDQATFCKGCGAPFLDLD
jgi:hypothetical protein